MNADDKLKHCCHYHVAPGTPENERSFDLNTSYFTKVRGDANALTPRLFKSSCHLLGFINPTTECRDEEYEEKGCQAKALDYRLYGRYRAQFKPCLDDKRVKSTGRWGYLGFKGINTLDGMHELFIGSLPARADNLIIGDNLDRTEVQPFTEYLKKR
ncbi:hypothetical protein [Pseudomonas sp. D(2018)]|uniref:hypothetical protein n=1 Tax=Pseudomonas sp. D(2018) TaxID=2502238 RepID=UPI0010F90432|nr:hypothetical protein [Pseudomonas sp. D(2018)]